jgi:hypothetical protein
LIERKTSHPPSSRQHPNLRSGGCSSGVGSGAAFLSVSSLLGLLAGLGGGSTLLRRGLLLLEISEMSGLVVYVHDGLVALLVERTELLSSRCRRRLVEVARHHVEGRVALGRDTELLVDDLRLLGSLRLLVEVLEDVHELGGVAVLLVCRKGALDSVVGDGIAVGEVLGDDACAGLLLLLDVVVAILGLVGGGRLVASDLVDALGRTDLDGVGAELGVVEEERGLSSGGLLEGDRGRLVAVQSQRMLKCAISKQNATRVDIDYETSP